MAGIRKREWITKKGVKKFCYEITYYYNNKQYRKSGFKTKIEAQKHLEEVTNRKNDTNITFEKLSSEYIEKHCKLHCKKTTYKLYETYLKVNLNRFRKLKVKDITHSIMNNLLCELKDEELSNKSINNILIFIKAVFNYGVDNEYINQNPSKKIKKLPNNTNKDRNFLTEEQITSFLRIAKIETPKHYMLFYTAIYTGMRRGELLGLEWQDIDFVKKEIYVQRQWYQSEVSDTKTLSSNRRVKMSDNLTEELLKYKKQYHYNSNIVFCNDKGEHQHAWNMTERYFKRVLKKMKVLNNIKTSNLNNLKFHDLRHTYASIMLSKGAPIKFVQEQLGHSSSKMTLDIYNHIMPKESDFARNIIDEINKSEHKMSIAI